MAQIIERKAWSTPHFDGWRVIIEAATLEQAEAEAATLGPVGDIIPVAAGFEAIVISAAAGSRILTMHRRYEEAGEDYSRLDRAHRHANPDTQHFITLGNRELLEEQNALRVAILRQVPVTWEEAVAMLFHANTSFDIIADAKDSDWNDDEATALGIALQHVLDFVVCEQAIRPEALGRTLALEVERVRKLRMRRSGRVEG